jgi:hypothetical protein
MTPGELLIRDNWANGLIIKVVVGMADMAAMVEAEEADIAAVIKEAMVVVDMGVVAIEVEAMAEAAMVMGGMEDMAKAATSGKAVE